MSIALRRLSLPGGQPSVKARKIRQRAGRVLRPALAVGLLLFVGACRGGDEAQSTGGAIRLVERFAPETVTGGETVAREVEPVALWRFDRESPEGELAATFGWRALVGVSDLRVEDGRLTGEVTDDLAVLHVEPKGERLGEDQLHAIEVRLRIGGGETVGAGLFGQERFDDARFLDMARYGETSWSAAIAPSTEPSPHTLVSQRAQRASAARHLVLTLHGAAGERFEIESVRIVSEREHLAGVASGPGWQGLTDVYHDTLVARSPERLRFPLTMPAGRPWLDLSVGSPEAAAPRFQVAVDAGDGAERVLDRRVTTPHRWEAAAVDLSRWAGREVVLELALEAEEPGTLGFWGAPTVRTRGAAAASDGARPQGVVLLVADTLRPDHLDAYGHQRETAPTVARLAREGVRFADVVSAATWTKASVPSIVTSLPVTSHGVSEFDGRLSDTAVTLAELYRDAGYATAAFSSVLFTGRFSNLQQGYDVLHEGSSIDGDDYYSKTAREYVDRAAEWIEAHREEPFFVFLHVFDPHDPLEPRPPDDVRWADPALAERHAEWRERVREEIDDPLLKQFGMPTRADLEAAAIDPAAYIGHDRDWYDGSIRGMDTQIARLLGRLEELGLGDRVLLAFVSDHGEELLEHGRTFHGQSVYGELAQVPLILHGPGIEPAGKVVEQTVRTLDLMPTLLELSAIERPPFLQGLSLVPLIRAADSAGASGWREQPAVIEKLRVESFGAPPPLETQSRAIVHQGWKLVHHEVRLDGGPEFELFDHRADPLDLADLAPRHPDVVERLAAQLERWRRHAEAARLPETENAEELSAAERERLRSLGYVQ